MPERVWPSFPARQTRGVSHNRIVNGLFAALCASPWLLLVSAYGEALIAAVRLSHWPRPWLDDPKQIDALGLHTVTLLLIVFTSAAVPSLAFTLLAGGPSLRSRAHIAWLTAFGAGVGLLSLLAYVDPGQVWYWLGD